MTEYTFNIKYDDASWHYGSDDFPPESPEDFGATHIALFLKWCFIKGWAGDYHLKEQPEDTQKVVDGAMSATEFFFIHCDGKLADLDISKEGNEFAQKYYGDDGLYLQDYHEHFGELEYLASEDVHDFDKFSSVLESRLSTGILTLKQLKPWWKFW